MSLERLYRKMAGQRKLTDLATPPQSKEGQRGAARETERVVVRRADARQVRGERKSKVEHGIIEEALRRLIG